VWGPPKRKYINKEITRKREEKKDMYGTLKGIMLDENGGKRKKLRNEME
jgi:hypothetical protein